MPATVDPGVSAQKIILAIAGPVIAIPVALIQRLNGQADSAIFLHEASFLTARAIEEEGGGEGWFFLPQETGLAGGLAGAGLLGKLGSWREIGCGSAGRQRQIRAQLREIGLLQERRRGIPARTEYRIDLERYAEWLGGTRRPAVPPAPADQPQPQPIPAPADDIPPAINCAMVVAASQATNPSAYLAKLRREYRAGRYVLPESGGAGEAQDRRRLVDLRLKRQLLDSRIRANLDLRLEPRPADLEALANLDQEIAQENAAAKM